MGFVLDDEDVEYDDLETRFGSESAQVILRTLELLEGVSVTRSNKLTDRERLQHVFQLMKENMLYQTKH